MSIEQIFKQMHGYRFKIAEYISIYLISLVMNFLSDPDVLSGQQTLMQKMTDLNNSAVFVLVLLILFAVLFYSLYWTAGYYSRKNNISAAFTDTMINYTDKIAQPDIAGGLSWGLGKTVWMAPNMILGLEPKDVIVAEYDDAPYKFKAKLKKKYEAFTKSKFIQDIQKQGNDLPRYMLTRYGPNFNKNHPLLTIQLKKTYWRQCQFVWHRFVGEKNEKQKRNQWHNDIISEHLEKNLKGPKYPNSFCLHLIIETCDGKVLITEISKEKENDYPTTKAASIGEQIELSDFIEAKDFQHDFVTEWTKRAVCEEFGIDAKDYEEEFDEKTLRVLSLDIEMDIYNFALVCTIKMRHDCNQFKKVVNTTIEHKEISAMSEMEIEDIPGILMAYPENKQIYHPSSYLRLLLFYLHKNGYRKTCKVFSKQSHGD